MADVTFTAITQPAPACYPPDLNALLTLLATQGLRGTVPDNAGGGVFVGSIAPSSSLTNKVWFKIDQAGRPLGIYMFYNGNWRKVYTGSFGDIKLYIGPFNGVFDGTGRGVVGGDQDGWAVCNGQNGAPNLDGNYPCCAVWNGSAWVANPDGLGYRGSGGVRGIQIAPSNLPQLHVNAHGIDVVVGSGSLTRTAIAQQTQPVAGVWSVNETVNSPNSVLPSQLFIATAYLIFLGYA